MKTDQLSAAESKLLSVSCIFGGVFAILLGGAMLWAGHIVGALGLTDASPQLSMYNLTSASLEGILLTLGASNGIIGSAYLRLARGSRRQNGRAPSLGIIVAVSSVVINILSTLLFGLENILNLAVAAVILALLPLTLTHVKSIFRWPQMRSILPTVLVLIVVVISPLIYRAFASQGTTSLINVGDQWTYHYNTNETVTDSMLRAESCGLTVSYVEQVQSSDSTDTLWVNPDLGLKREVYSTSSGFTTYQYDPPLSVPLPLTVGTQWWSNSTVTASIVATNPINFTGYRTPQTSHISTLFRVVGTENRTVKAGRFFSYKIEVYSETGLLRIDWFSPQARTIIYREEFNADGSTRSREMTNFSGGKGISASGTLSILALCPILNSILNDTLAFVGTAVLISVILFSNRIFALKQRRTETRYGI